MLRTITGLALILASLHSHAALVRRSGGQAYYDTVLNITWVANADLAKTSGFDDDGWMTWSSAQAWIASLNSASYLGVNNWRLPYIADTGSSGCNFAYSGTDCGYNVDLSTGEMARLFYSTLGNNGYYNTSGNPTGCSGASPYCLTRTAPFTNLGPNDYWSGTQYAPNTTNAWLFDFSDGIQGFNGKTSTRHAWAVRSGDIGITRDADTDGVPDPSDNCTLIANAIQCDSDGDGYGNHCDGDLNNNGFTNAFDTTLYRAQLGQPSVGPTYNQADLNCNGFVNAFDTPLFRSLLGTGPGPAGGCTPGAPGCEWLPGDLVTYSQVQYGGTTASGPVLAANFGIYAGFFEIGLPANSGFSIVFTNSTALINYLPSSGTPAALNSDLLNTSSSSSGEFGGEAAALKLNVDFNDRDLMGGDPNITLGDLHVCGVTTAGLTGLNGQTVRQVLATAHTSLGGGSTGYSIPTLSAFVGELNAAFLGGSVGSRATNLVNGACP